MRKINTADVFKMARLMKSASLTESIKRAYVAGKEKDANIEEVGMNAIMDIMGSCCNTGTEKVSTNCWPGSVKRQRTRS